MSEHSFHVTIQQKTEAGWLVVAETPAYGDRLPARYEALITREEGKALFEQLREVGAEPPAYGTRLRQAVFRAQVAEGWARAVGQADVLHVFLTPEAADWRDLYWEWLEIHIDGQVDFANLTQRTPTSFNVPSASDRRFPPIGRRALRALVVVSSPSDSVGRNNRQYGLEQFDGPRTADRIRDVLAAVDIPTDVLAYHHGSQATHAHAGSPTLDAVLGALTDHTYTLLHLVCHGRQTPDGPVLYLSDTLNGVDPVPAGRLVDGLRRVGKAGGLPRLVFLSVCESGSERGVASLARRLVEELGIPAVIAMRSDISQVTAERLASAFYPRLVERGAVDLALAEARAGLFSRADVHVPFLYGRLGRRPLFTVGEDSPLAPEEILRGLDRLGEVLDAQAPVLRAAYDELAPAVQAANGPAVTDVVKRKADQATEELNRICGEALGISFAGLARGPAPDTRVPDCPFRGLAPFRTVDGRFFFGREDLTSSIVNRLATERILAVLGRSGCGKSSLIHAGVVPRWQATHKNSRVWDVDSADLSASLETLPTTEGPELIVIDQFERLLTSCSGPARRALLDRLLATSGTSDRSLLLGIRSDFLGECADHPRFRLLLQDHQVLVGPFTPGELRSAVERQALAGRIYLEGGLAARIIDEVGDETAAMSLVQLALGELWRRRHGPWLRNEELDAIGGARMVIARAAEEAYQRLSEADRDRCRDHFMRLVRVDATDPRRDTRERVNLMSLVHGGGSLQGTRELVQRLSTESPLLTVGDGEDPPVEIVHDTLLRNWPRLRDEWIAQNRRELRLRASLSQSVGEWERTDSKGEKANCLWHGARLAEAERLRDAGRINLTQRELDFIKASVHRRRLSRWSVGLTTASILGFVIFAAVREYVSVRTSLAREQKNLRLANARRLAAQSLLAGEQPGNLPLLLAVESVIATRDDGTVIAESDAALRRAIGEQGGLTLPKPDGGSWGDIVIRPQDRTLILSTIIRAVPGEGRGLGTAKSMSSVYAVGINEPLSFGTPKWLLTVDAAVEHLSVSPSGRWIVAESAYFADLYDLKSDSGPIRIPVTPEHGPFYNGQKVRITGDDRWAVVGVEDGSTAKVRSLVPLRLWRLSDNARDDLPSETAVSAISPDGRWLIAEQNGRFTAYDLASDAPSRAGIPLPASVRRAVITNGRIAAMDASGEFGFLNQNPLKGLSVAVTLDPSKVANGLFPTQDGRWIITLGDDAWWLWSLSASRDRDAIRLAKASSWPAVHFSPGGGWAAVSTGGDLYLLRLELQENVPRVFLLPRRFGAWDGFRAFSFDGRWLVTAESDQRRMLDLRNDKLGAYARLWDLSRPGAPGRDFPLRGGDPVNMAVVDPAGRWLVTGGYFQPRMYPLSSTDFLDVARRLCDRNLTRAEWSEYFPGVDYRKTFDDLPGPGDGR